MPQLMKYEVSGDTLPCDRCGLQTRMNRLLQSGDEGESWQTVQHRSPRTKLDRDARYCEPCAKEACGIFPKISLAQVRKAMKTLAREKQADSEIADLRDEAGEAKKTVLRFLIQNDSDQLTLDGYTAKYRSRTSSSLDKDFLEEVLTEEQLREATRTSYSQFVQVSAANADRRQRDECA